MKFITPLLIALSCVAIIAIMPSSNSQSQFTHIGYDMCMHKELSKIALKHGADFMTNHDFDMPALDIIGDKQTIQTIQDELIKSKIRTRGRIIAISPILTTTPSTSIPN